MSHAERSTARAVISQKPLIGELVDDAVHLIVGKPPA